MKKLIAMMLVLALAVSMAACGGKSAAKEPLVGTMEENVMKIMEISPVEFMGGAIGVDLSDVDAVKYFTGLSSADKITDVSVYESMTGSQAFSLILARVADAKDAETVAQEMNDNIDTRKWICVGADQKVAAGYSDTVMLIMLDSQLGLKTQSFVDAFQQVCGGDLDFTI